MILVLAFALLFSSRQDDNRTQPLVSATDPAYLACSVWNGHEWTKPATRSVRTAAFESAKGFRAYAEVTAAVHSASCGNTLKLYVGEGDGNFKVAYRKGESENGGYGIRLVGWSPDGNKLLVQVNSWEYETDLGYGHLALIYDAAAHSAKEIKTLDETLTRHFGSDCEFEHSVEGWSTNDRLLVKISKTPLDESYDQHFCVEKPIVLAFDLRKGTLEQVHRYGQSVSVKAP